MPSNDLDITPAIYEIREEAIQECDLTLLNQRHLSPNAASLSTSAMPTFLRRVRTHQLYKMLQQQDFHRQWSFDDFAREERLAEKSEDSFLQDLLQQRRPLRPRRKARAVKSTRDALILGQCASECQ